MSEIDQAVSFNSYTTEIERAVDAFVLLINTVRDYRAGPSSVRCRVQYVYAGVPIISIFQKSFGCYALLAAMHLYGE